MDSFQTDSHSDFCSLFLWSVRNHFDRVKVILCRAMLCITFICFVYCCYNFSKYIYIERENLQSIILHTSVKQHCPSPLSGVVCVCMCCVCVCVPEPLLMSTLCVSFLLHFLITFSTLMYIACVILCLLSAFSHKVGALQIYIIIIVIIHQVDI